MDLKNRVFFIGATASLILLILYFSVLSLVESYSHAVSKFLEMWYLISILVIGFGLQVGLYSYIRTSIREKQMKNPTAAVATSGGISTGSMIACCLHHLVDVLPILGLAALSVFLIQYQIFFIIFGILANIVGIIIMLEIIQRHNLSEGFLKRKLIYNMNKVKKIAIGSAIILLLITFFLINNQAEINNKIELLSKKDSQSGISFEVIPLDVSFKQPISFEIKIDTHSGSLDFDLTKVSKIEDNLGNEYQPLKWEGPPPGGHHISGVLFFGQIDNKAKKIKLTIQDAYLRVFEWEL